MEEDLEGNQGLNRALMLKIINDNRLAAKTSNNYKHNKEF